MLFCLIHFYRWHKILFKNIKFKTSFDHDIYQTHDLSKIQTGYKQCYPFKIIFNKWVLIFFSKIKKIINK